MINNNFERVLSTVEKPARYIGGEVNSVHKDPDKVDLRFAFCFPDSYEVGMSHLGMKILYSLLNNESDIYCERFFSVMPDAAEVFKENNIPPQSLESFTALSEFDIIGFTLQYELSYTNILSMLDDAGIPLLSEDREGLHNLVIAGGPAACNPEPIADFIDLFILGEAEEAVIELCDLYKASKKKGISKKEFLKKAMRIEGVYVPSFYQFSYNEDGTIKELTVLEDAPRKVSKRIIKDLDAVFYPERFVVPYIDIVHDRAMLEVMRGCIRGCRFCQAGYIYRPLREKSSDVLSGQAKSLCETSGYDEISLSSLSTSDYTGLMPLLNTLTPWTAEKRVHLSLPSLRVDNFEGEMLKRSDTVKKGSLTFAPEAGTQRLRDVINKNVSDADIEKMADTALAEGHTKFKLYFMLGLPTETDEDIRGIVRTASGIVGQYYKSELKGRGFNINISVATFVPKPHTPFQFEPQDDLEEVIRKQRILFEAKPGNKVRINYHDGKTSFIEAVFARGDRRVCKALLKAYQNGCIFDGWDEHFKFDKWLEAFSECSLDPHFYANRLRSYDEINPWDHIDFGVSKEFLIDEHKKATASETTEHCRNVCSNCGSRRFECGVCYDRH